MSSIRPITRLASTAKQPTRHVADRYVGLPWRDGGRDAAGVDCWGLPYLDYRELLGIELPRYEIDPLDAAGILAAVSAAMIGGDWIETRTPRDHDVVTMSHRSHPYHMGLWFAGGLVVHATHTRFGVVAESMTSARNRGFNTFRTWRYAARTET